jgi:hypothetical protein
MIEVNQQASMVGAVREKSMDPDEVDRLIERRAKDKSPKDAANEREAIWKASEAEHHAEHLRQRMAKQAEYVRALETDQQTNHVRMFQAHEHLLDYVEDYCRLATKEAPHEQNTNNTG